MEYTKDLILNVRYDEEGSKFKIGSRPNNVIKKLKSSKIIMTSLIGLLMFVAIDTILLINFIHILEIA